MPGHRTAVRFKAPISTTPKKASDGSTMCGTVYGVLTEWGPKRDGIGELAHNPMKQ